MFKSLLQRWWNDDDGALIAIEFLFVATILILGIIVGLVGVRTAINAELTELGNAILALSEGYAFSGVSGCCAFTDGSQAIDTPALLPNPICTPPAIPSVIDVIPCF
jgi:Flp pilus assembly pilin Flp